MAPRGSSEGVLARTSRVGIGTGVYIHRKNEVHPNVKDPRRRSAGGLTRSRFEGASVEASGPHARNDHGAGSDQRSAENADHPALHSRLGQSFWLTAFLNTG